jgi:CSLREA domain-containing protein
MGGSARIAVIVLTLAATSVASVAPARAAVFQVTKTADTFDGVCNADCSLREAVDVANATTAPDEIVLPAGTFALDRAGADDVNAIGDLDVTQDLVIRGAGPAATTIRVFGADDRVLHVLGPGTDLELRDLTVAGGRATEDGGGIASPHSGALTLGRVVVRDNLAQGQAAPTYGGGIFKGAGRLVARDSAIVGNRVTSTGYGGGIGLNGGGVGLDLENVTIAGNHASGLGGGIHTNNTIAASLAHVTVVGNEAPAETEIGGDTSLFALRSSIVASATNAPACNPTYHPASHGGNAGPAACGLVAPSDAVTADPRLSSLGGDLPVLEPLPGSPAIDRAVGPCPPTDARGVPRPLGAACDAGAAEAPAPVPPPSTTTTRPRRLSLPKRLRLDRTRRRVLVPLACPAGPTCRGRLRITVRRRVRGRMRTVTLASATVRIPAGKRRTIRAPLTRAGRSRLRRARSIRAALVVDVGRGVQRRSVVIRRR